MKPEVQVSLCRAGRCPVLNHHRRQSRMITSMAYGRLLGGTTLHPANVERGGE
jgi:hypothetical protein